jgi:hypothetical protein
VCGRIVREGSLGSQHLKETTESMQEGDFARSAICMGLRAAKFAQQLHFDPVEGDLQVKEKACSDPGQGHSRPNALPIEHLHVFPFQKLKTVLHTDRVGDTW